MRVFHVSFSASCFDAKPLKAARAEDLQPRMSFSDWPAVLPMSSLSSIKSSGLNVAFHLALV